MMLNGYPKKNFIIILQWSYFSLLSFNFFNSIRPTSSRYRILSSVFFYISYTTPAVFIVFLLKRHKLTIEEAQEKSDYLSSFVSDEEYNII